MPAGQPWGTELKTLAGRQRGADNAAGRVPRQVTPSPQTECSGFSPPITVVLLIFLCLEGLLFFTFTAVMFSTQIHSICNDETVGGGGCRGGQRAVSACQPAGGSSLAPWATCPGFHCSSHLPTAWQGLGPCGCQPGSPVPRVPAASFRPGRPWDSIYRAASGQSWLVLTQVWCRRGQHSRQRPVGEPVCPTWSLLPDTQSRARGLRGWTCPCARVARPLWPCQSCPPARLFSARLQEIERLKSEKPTWERRLRWEGMKSVFGGPPSLLWMNPFVGFRFRRLQARPRKGGPEFSV